MLQNKEARDTKEEFRCVKLNPTENYGVLTVSHLDLVMTSIIDRFQNHVGMDIDFPNGNRENYNKIMNGGTVPNESSRRLETLLLTATSNILNEVISAFQSHLWNYNASMKFEISMSRNGEQITILGNRQHEFTNGFEYSKNIKFFKALRIKYFTSVICAWLGSIVYWVMLHSPTIEDTFFWLYGNVPIKLTYANED